MNETYYGDYIQVDKLLNAQHPKSAERGNENHDETLFIIVHQVYELWFKQILHELRSVRDIFASDKIEEGSLGLVNTRLERVVKIQHLLIDQLLVMESLTPMDFMEFRNLLVPASGFQSIQFRELEILMGLPTRERAGVDRSYFMGRLSKQDQQRIDTAEAELSLLKGLEKWLARMPFTKNGDFNFLKEYRDCVNEMLNDEAEILKQNLATLPQDIKNFQMAHLENTKMTFASLFDKNQYQQLLKTKKCRLSQEATLNALFIMLYRNQPLLHQPYRLLSLLIDLDENFSNWRYRHAIMVQRMVGTKMGTGGSSGHDYLASTVQKNRVYKDLSNLSTFLLPNSKIPKLPKKLRSQLDFHLSDIHEL